MGKIHLEGLVNLLDESNHCWMSAIVLIEGRVEEEAVEGYPGM